MYVTLWEFYVWYFIIIQEQFKQKKLYVCRSGNSDLVTGALRVPEGLHRVKSFVGVMVNDSKIMAKLSQKNLSAKYLLLVNEYPKNIHFFSSENKTVM